MEKNFAYALLFCFLAADFVDPLTIKCIMRLKHWAVQITTCQLQIVGIA